jgi:hypothetical protein
MTNEKGLLIIVDYIFILRILRTKKHHPHSRAERLALKKLDEKPKKGAAKVRHHIIETLKEREAEDELREVAGSLAHS